MKIAVVVQRYGPSINGGAELHARYIAERLARHCQVEVLTTCASDYVTWRNELPPGVEPVNGVQVRRFKVTHERDPLLFGKRSERVFAQRHSIGDELDWLDAEGPTSPSLVDYITKHAAEFDYCLFFSYRYYHAYYGARAAGARAILVPTAERDATIGLSIFQPLFRSVRGLMYNSPEEREMIQTISGNQDVPGVVVGVGSDVPNNPQAFRFRQKYNIRGPFAIYVGRIDQNKGCTELFEFFQGYQKDPATKLSLVLVGNTLLPIPQHPRIRHLGFLNDTDKFDAMAAAELLVMPSYYESLSMVALEAWALGKAGTRQRQVRRAEGPVHPQQCRAVLRHLRGIRRRAPGDGTQPLADRFARTQRPPVLSRQLRLAGDRAEIPRHVRAAEGRRAGAHQGSAARLVRSTTPGSARR